MKLKAIHTLVAGTADKPVTVKAGTIAEVKDFGIKPDELRSLIERGAVVEVEEPKAEPKAEGK